MRLFASQITQSILSVWRRKRDENAITKTKRDRRQEWLADMRLLSFAMARSVLSFWGIMGWMSVGIVFGGLVAHNFLSQAVLCNQPVCMWLRFDGEKVLE